MIRPGFTLLFLLKKKPWEKYLFPQLLNSSLCSCGWSNLFSSLMGFLTGSIQIGCSMFLTHSKWKDNIRARLYLSGVWVAQEVDVSHSICSICWRHFCVHYGKKKVLSCSVSLNPVLIDIWTVWLPATYEVWSRKLNAKSKMFWTKPLCMDNRIRQPGSAAGLYFSNVGWDMRANALRAPPPASSVGCQRNAEERKSQAG